MQTRLIQSPCRDAWNAFVAGSPYGHILQSWEWGELKARTGWDPVRLALFDGNEIRAAAQVLIRSLPYQVGQVAYIPKGPVLDYDDPALLRAMLATMQDLAKQRGVISLKIEPEVTEPGPLGAELLSLGLQPAPPVQMRSTIWVDVSGTEEDILNNFKQKTRYNTRLAVRKGVTVTAGSDRDLDAWFQMYSVTSQRDGFTIHDLEYYRSVLQILRPHGLAELLLAHHEGDLLAGIIVFAFGKKGQYMYGASSNEKRNLMAPYLVQWEGMRWARSRGVTTYDLWGIPDQLDESEDLWGVYRHKRGYGGQMVRYVGAYDLVRSPVRHVLLERVARPLFKRVARLSV